MIQHTDYIPHSAAHTLHGCCGARLPLRACHTQDALSSCSLNSHADNYGVPRVPCGNSASIRKNRSQRCEFARSVRVTFSSLLVFVALGLRSWVHHQRFHGLEPVKANARLSSIPNNRSVRTDRSFLQSPECFGRTRLRLILRLRPIVRCVRPRCIWPVIASGRAMRSPRSSVKFLNGIRCAT